MRTEAAGNATYFIFFCIFFSANTGMGAAALFYHVLARFLHNIIRRTG
jgi:hypothetical protein